MNQPKKTSFSPISHPIDQSKACGIKETTIFHDALMETVLHQHTLKLPNEKKQTYFLLLLQLIK